MNKQKFVHYVMLTFTYGIGIGTAVIMKQKRYTKT